MDKQEAGLMKFRIILVVGFVVGIVLMWAIAGRENAFFGGLIGLGAAMFLFVYKKLETKAKRKNLIVITAVPLTAFAILFAAGAEIAAFLVAIALSYSIVPFLRFLERKGMRS